MRSRLAVLLAAWAASFAAGAASASPAGSSCEVVARAGGTVVMVCRVGG